MNGWLAVVFLSALAGLTGAGCAYALFAAALVRKFARQPATRISGPQPAVTLMKPLHGSDASLSSDLRACCAQDYAGPIQVVFGVHSADDSAVPVVRRLTAASPNLDWRLNISSPKPDGHPGTPAPHAGRNPKVANLISMAPAIRHEILVISDADIVVDASYLGRVISLLEQPDIGVVTCLYHGVAGAGVWARLAAMGIDYHFLPAVLTGIQLGTAKPCFGSTIALRRSTLERIGGFRALADGLADDYAIGKAVRALGLRVAVAPLLVGHRCTERSALELLRHELRWARTIRTIDPAGYAGSVIAHPVPFAIALCLASGFAPLSLAAFALAVICRGILMEQVDRALNPGTQGGIMRPARRLLPGIPRDVLSLVTLIGSFLGRWVVWQGRRYRVRSDGTIVQAKGLN